jgi:hypothetical protein
VTKAQVKATQPEAVAAAREDKVGEVDAEVVEE